MADLFKRLWDILGAALTYPILPIRSAIPVPFPPEASEEEGRG
ncbi:MAG: hypothetical protein ACE5HK_07150 [Candidatus Methylomirabilales bacterium]